MHSRHKFTAALFLAILSFSFSSEAKPPQAYPIQSVKTESVEVILDLENGTAFLPDGKTLPAGIKIAGLDPRANVNPENKPIDSPTLRTETDGPRLLAGSARARRSHFEAQPLAITHAPASVFAAVRAQSYLLPQSFKGAPTLRTEESVDVESSGCVDVTVYFTGQDQHGYARLVACRFEYSDHVDISAVSHVSDSTISDLYLDSSDSAFQGALVCPQPVPDPDCLIVRYKSNSDPHHSFGNLVVYADTFLSDLQCYECTPAWISWGVEFIITYG